MDYRSDRTPTFPHLPSAKIEQFLEQQKPLGELTKGLRRLANRDFIL